MDPQAAALDCPLCGAPVHVAHDEAIVICPMCDAVGVPLPRRLDPVTGAAVGRRH